MTTWREKNRERMRKYRASHIQELRDYERARDRSGRKALPKEREFVGVDGEGETLSSGYHAYTLLRAGDDFLVRREGDVRLRTYDCLEFLSNLPPNRIYVAYFFDYDVAKILEDMSFKRLQYLMDREARKRTKGGGFFSVSVGPYEVDYLPRKEFKVRKRDGGKWVVIHDVGSFFQCAFIKALEMWGIGNDRQRELIASGKDMRSEFATVPFEEILNYNHLEVKLLVRLMDSFRQACEDVGYIPTKWQGPGLLAEAMLEAHSIPRTKDLPLFDDGSNLSDANNESVAAFGRMAFYGGRFETSIVGRTPPGVRQYDLNGAYPAALLTVPCLVHGEWERVTEKRQVADDELSICYGTFRWPRRGKNPHFMGFPVRLKDGSIRFPFDGIGWYWSVEIRAAKHQVFTALDSWIYHRKCDCQPFAFIKDVYTERKRIGKGGKGIVLKLALNSLYGKMAQSIGSPKFANPILASYITAVTRACMQYAIHASENCEKKGVACGSDIYMIATDAVFAREEIPGLVIGDGLGDWSEEVHDEGLFIIQPGLYFDLSGEVLFKTRGVPKRKVIEHRDEFLAGFDRMRETHHLIDGDVLIPMQLFVGIRQALHRHSLKLLGQWVDYKDPITGEPGRRTSFDWQTKRRPQPVLFPPGVQPPYLLTMPYLGTVNERPDGLPIQTVPYSKDIGGVVARALRQLMLEDQPDWGASL